MQRIAKNLLLFTNFAIYAIKSPQFAMKILEQSYERNDMAHVEI